MPNKKHNDWVVAKSGTRYVKTKPKPKPPREPNPDLGSILQRKLKDSQGDVLLAILMAVRNLLAKPEHWHPKHRAVGKTGQISEPCSSETVRWSIFGAVSKVTTPGLEYMKREVLAEIKKVLPRDGANSHSLMHWEPSQKHSMVLWVLNMAIANRKKET